MSYSNPHDPWETDPSPSLTRGKWVTHMSYLEWLDLWRALAMWKVGERGFGCPVPSLFSGTGRFCPVLRNQSRGSQLAKRRLEDGARELDTVEC